MKTSVALLILLAVNSSGLQSQRKGKPPQTFESVSYCQLFRNLDRYLKRPVRLNGTWTYGFEWSFLSDRGCLGEPKSMLELADEDQLCAASKRYVKKIDH